MKGVVTIVLAAGVGERMGGPKALLRVRLADGCEAPLAIAHARARLGAESERVLIVARAVVARVLAPYASRGVEIVVSDAAEALGPAGSIAVAAAKLGDAAIAIVTPVDTPLAKGATVARLLERASGAILAARPCHEGRRGHPVALRRAALERYLHPAPPPLRDHLRALGAACADVDVEDPEALVDFDRPSDLRGFGIVRANS